MAAIKLINLNIELDRHLEVIIPFLKKEKADVVCLQEVFDDTLPIFTKELSMNAAFLPMVAVPGKTQIPHQGFLGLAILAKEPISQTSKEYYAGGDGNFPKFMGLGKNNNKRGILTVKFTKSGQIFAIATTHFSWAPDGKTSEEQLFDYQKMEEILDQIGEVVFCGDFNNPRGEKIFDSLAKKYKNNIPSGVLTTIDPKIHRAGNLNLVIDGLFTSKEYLVSNIHLVDGLSDHQAIVAEIEKN